MTGPTGPCCTGPTGASSTGDGPRALLKFVSAVTIPAVVTLGAAGSPTSIFLVGYLADGGVVDIGPVPPPDLILAPNYPVGDDPITFDELAALIKSATPGVPVGIVGIPPVGFQLVVELVRNGNIPTGLEAVFTAGPTGLLIPDAPFTPTGALQDTGELAVTIAAGETYDLRVILRNPTGAPVIVSLESTALPIQVSATLRAPAA